MRPSPNSSGHGESESSQRSRSGLADARIEVALEAGELLALGLDQLGRGLRDEALVRELALGACDLLAQPRALGVDVAVRLHALRLDDRIEDPLLLALERH